MLTVLALLALGAFVAFVAFGDALLTLLLRKFAHQYVGDRIQLFWSLRDGVLEINNIVLAKAVLPPLEPLAGFPVDLEKLELQQFVIELPLVDRFLVPTSWRKRTALMHSRVHIAGLQVGVTLNSAEKWIWTHEDNLARLQQAVQDAAKARLARVNSWTQAISAKLDALTAARETIRKAKQQPPVNNTPNADATPAAPAFWHKLIDEVIDSFAIVVRRLSVTVRDEHSSAGLGITLEKFEIGRSDASVVTSSNRRVQLLDFEVFVNPHARAAHTEACALVPPMAFELIVRTPRVFQTLLMRVGGEQQPPRTLELTLTLGDPTPFALQLRPAQIRFLMSILRPMQFYADWHSRASVQDEIACVELTSEQADEYKTLFREQWLLDNKTGLFQRLRATYQHKLAINVRKSRLAELEATCLATHLVELRASALAWDVPSNGKALPHATDAMLRRRTLLTFLDAPLTTYEPELPAAPPMFHSANVAFTLKRMRVELLTDTDACLLAFFVHDLTLETTLALAKIDPSAQAIVVHLAIERFGLLDERNKPTNVFRQLLDRNLDADSMLSLRLVQLGSGHNDVKIVLSKFSVLVVFDPLIAAMHTFLPTLSEDEQTQLRFLPYELLKGPQSPEQRERALPVFTTDVGPDFTPLLLGGLLVGCTIELQGVELCLLGDATSPKSHVLAFTSDTKLQIASSKHHESIELELEDVALQPCRVVLCDDGIDLDLAGLRTILELEGDGVDLELAYSIRMADPHATNGSHRSSAPSTGQSAPKSGVKLWGVARGAAAKKHIAEVSHPELKSAEEIAVHSQKRDRVRAAAKRKVIMKMSDFALNFSPSDLGVFLSIMKALNDSMVEDKTVVHEREELTKRIAAKKKAFAEQRYRELLKSEFKKRDVDQGGSLDVSEIASLLQSLPNCKNLTKDEFDATVRDFVAIVDSDSSGDISLDEFMAALDRNKIAYPRLHKDVVELTGREYVDPVMQRNNVPTVQGDTASTLANAAALSAFWNKYEEQVGATKTSLNHQPPLVVQKKLVRTFLNYEFAQEAWYRIVNPSLTKVAEQSVWLLTKEMPMGRRSDVIDQLLSSFDVDDPSATATLVPAGSVTPSECMFVHTVVSTAFGGFYFRLLDDMLPLGMPALEVSLEELAIYANVSLWEGDLMKVTTDVDAHKRAKNNFGVAKISFDVYGKYYNVKARQVEPFLEFYQGVLDVKKDPDAHTDIVYTSDRYLQLNVTSAFMETVNTNVKSFTSVEGASNLERAHIKEEDGIFWLLNDTGVSVTYCVVAKKETKEKLRVETVTAVVAVPTGNTHPCKLLNVDDELKEYEQQSLKEKHLRQAFRNADSDHSGELDTNEVRGVLREIYEEEDRQRHARNSTTYRKSDSTLSDDELTKHVEDFVALADTDGSGNVSWEEFKVAIAKMRETIDRYITLEVDGFKPIHDIPIISTRETQVYELVPLFPDVESEASIAALYTQGVELLNKIGKPSMTELARAYACLRRVKDLDPAYEWIDSYYSKCLRVYVPLLVAVHISVDSSYGLEVHVESAVRLRNDTAKLAECLLVDANGDVSQHNPEQPNNRERFYKLAPKASMPMPLDLVDVGMFAIRQVGETEWSNFLPLSVRDQRLYKHLTRFEQREARHAQTEHESISAAVTALVTDKLGSDVLLPNPFEYVGAGQDVVYPSKSCIDNQPTAVIETISMNDTHLGVWALVVQPQLVLHNVLPCGIEYAIVQPSDCPRDTLDSKGAFRLTGASPSSKHSKAVKTLGDVDYFSYVSDVNGRRQFVESGESVQVFGLDLNAPALMKMRLCATSSNRAEQWSTPFVVGLNAERTAFNAEKFELRFDNGPGIVYQQEWQPNAARSIHVFVPYWIQNRSGLDVQLKVPKGTVYSIEQHRALFNGDKAIPMLVNGPPTKANVSIKPFQATPQQYESETLAADNTKKLLPKFDKVDWSDSTDMSSVGTLGELTPSGKGDYAFVLAFEVRAAPGQFMRSKILVLSPRYVVLNHVPRSFQLTPVLLDKKQRASKLKDGSNAANDMANCTVKANERIAIYTFTGKEKHWTALRLRDYARDSGKSRDPGDWSRCIPLKAADAELKANNDFNLWTRGTLGDGPIVNVTAQMTEQTIFVTLKDVSRHPPYRIENRSTQQAFKYVQRNVRGDPEEITLKPLTSHSFVWEDPLAEKLQLKISPVQWKVPTIVDFMHIGVLANMTPSELHGEVYIDGATRVLAIGDTTAFAAVRSLAFLNDWLSGVLIDMSIHGVGITVVDDHPQEVLNITMENLHFGSQAGSRTCVFTLHHIQLDDMSAMSPYPVVLAPLDSGFNSDKREGWLPTHDEHPFFALKVDMAPQTGLPIMNDFDVTLNSLVVKLSLEYLLRLSNVFAKFIPTADDATVRRSGIAHKNALLTLELSVPDVANSSSGTLLYFKRWHLSSFDFHLVFDSAQEGDRGEGISSIVGPTLGSIVGGIAHITPEFHFGEIAYSNTFFYEYDLIYDVVWRIVVAVLGQWYKIVGSVELLGDPVGLATEIVDGFALAGRQFKRDIRGQSLRKGESAVTLAQTVVGAPFQAIGKISNGLGDVVKKSTGFKSQESASQPRHVPEGLYDSGIVFGKSLAYGVRGFVKEPVRGAKNNGFKGFARGVGRGTMQLIASPVVGTLGVVEKMSQSVSNTTHLLDEKTFDGGRRPARDLVTEPLKPLSDSNVITEVEVHCLYIDGLPDKVNAQIVVKVTTPSIDGPPKVERYKSTTFRKTGTPKFDQSWLIGITSLETTIDINVYHKRKPLPKKLLGYLRFSIEDIYREFEAVPAKLLSDTKAKMRLKRRKRVRGSIISELASASANVEVRDESWKQRIRQTSSSISDDRHSTRSGRSARSNGVLSGGASGGADSGSLSDDSDSYEDDVEMLSNRSFAVNESYPPSPMAFELEACEPPAKMYLSIRYVNDMRRYA